MNKALFLDRDGVINEDQRFLFRKEEVRFVDGIVPLCLRAQELGYIIIVVTNQSGVGKGHYREEDVVHLHHWLSAELAGMGVHLTEIYYSPYHPEARDLRYRKVAECRKPRPGMVEQAILDHDIDVKRSLMIGDKESDRIAMEGLTAYILKSVYVPEHYDIETLYDVFSLL